MSALAHSHQPTMDDLERQRAIADGDEDLIPQHSTALALIERINPAQVFVANGLDPILNKIREEAMSRALDISTAKGRKEIASLAHQIAKSKTALDKAGKDLVAGKKQEVKVVDAERARGWDFLEALQHEIRKPLTEWEDREKMRVAAREGSLAAIDEASIKSTIHWQTLSLGEMNNYLIEIEAARSLSWEEFSDRAVKSINESLSAINAAILKRQAHDAEQAELARLRKEEEERKQREREERIAREAADKARSDAEEKARKEAEAEAARVASEKAKADQERERIEREKEAALTQARKAEEDKQAALAKAESDRIAAEEKAKRDADLAAQRERQRIDDEKRVEAEATAKREADKKHRSRINNEALQIVAPTVALAEPNLSAERVEAIAKAVIEAIARGQIPHIKISY